VSTSPRLAAAIVAASAGIVLSPAVPAMAQPHAFGHPAPITSVTDIPRGNVDGPVRANIFDEIKNFFNRVFDPVCTRVKCCPPKTLHC
jgi:hypothetical protein